MIGGIVLLKPKQFMIKQFYNPEPINPEPIIDLRPKSSLYVASWRDLTVVRIISFIIRLISQIFIIIFDLLYRFIRSLALFLVDIFFGVKELILGIKYTSVEQGLKLKRFLKVLLDVFLIIPRAIIKLLIRIFGVFKKTTSHIEIEVKKERAILIKKKVIKQSSLTFRIVNFILVLALIASPFFIVKIWQQLAPVRSSVMQSTASAFQGLFLAKDLIGEQNFFGANNAFESAGEDFLKAQTDLKEINSLLLELAGLMPDKNFKLAAESEHLLKAGSLSASIGAELTAAAAPAPKANIIYFLDNFIKHAIPAADEADALVHELNKVKISNLPEDYQAKFSSLKEQAEFLGPSLRESVVLAKQAMVFLGKQIDKRYLLVFQNNYEARASGGFIGSFALVDFSQGEMKNLTVPKGGTYDTEAGLYEKFVAPEPLWLLNPLWHFWDANWWPDWPTTARKLQWFYEKSSGPTVDGVISLTPTVMENFLKIHGPVDMTADYGVVIDADNFWEITQTLSEQKPNVTKEPKRIIGDLMAKLIADLPNNLNPDKTLALIKVLEQNLNQKQILFYFNDQSLEDSVKHFGWDGSIKETDQDYLMVVSTNIGGQKSDKAVVQTINHHAEILPDGQIIVNLSIVREHTAVKNEMFVGFRNVNWLRVYVPANSELISSSGWRLPDQFYFEKPDPKWQLDPALANENQAKIELATGTKIYQENGKTVFANWSMMDPGETAVINLKYRLPFTMTANESKTDLISKIKNYILPESSERYSLLIQKQPGSVKTKVNSQLIVNRGWQVLWRHPNDLIVTSNSWSISRPLETDLYNVVLFNSN